MDVGPKSIKQSMKDGEINTITDVISIILNSIDVIQKVHNCNIVHNDLKMDNMIAQKNSSGRWDVKVIDFGLSYIDEDQKADIKDQQFVHLYFAEIIQDFNFKIVFKQIEISPKDRDRLDTLKAYTRDLCDEEINIVEYQALLKTL